MKDNLYVTTTLPYSNANPHIGHTLEFVQADVIVRYFRNKFGKDKVWFNVGTDEHGLKMYKTAKKNGKEPQEYVDEFAEKWKEFCEFLQIDYDTFYRTSDKSHHEGAKKWWLKSKENGDIYKKKYTGLYCVGAEEFVTEKDLIDGKCPDHDAEPIVVSEENYFFRLSKFKEQLLKYYEENPNTLIPKRKFAELKNWIENMQDISISREKKNLTWGVDVPDDDEQIMYVWFDALTDYINVLDNPENFMRETDRSESLIKQKGIENWWPAIQLFGPDNLRFQSAIWQGMLASFNLPQTKRLLNHGMVLAEDGTKMSKSKGNGVSPFEQIEKFGVEAVRYYLIYGISTFGDSPYKEEELVNLYNANLANNFGNLLNRVIHLANSKESQINNFDEVDKEFKSKIEDLRLQAHEFIENFELQKYAEKINEISTFGNEYITEKAPWSKEISEDGRSSILNNLNYLLKTVSELYVPIIPNSANKALKMLENREKGVLFEKIEMH